MARALFAPEVYAESGLIPEADPESLWERYVRHWTAGDRFASLFFDPDHYAQQISTGAAPPIEPGDSIFLHWLVLGLPRRVVPTPRFDEEFYYRENQDIAAWGGFGFTHFLLYGLREGRRATAWFDPGWYASELGNAPLAEPPYVHFLTRGIPSGFTANRGLALFRDRWDCSVTRTQYDRLLAASMNWSRYLSADGFDLLLALYVPQSHRNHSGVDAVTELASYFERGLTSGTPPGPLFDANEYSRRAREAGLLDVQEGRLLLHWLAIGVAERIVPTARFDEAFYRKTNPDVARTSRWGFEHFICDGAFEGRRPNAAFPPPLEPSARGRRRDLPVAYRRWIREDFIASHAPSPRPQRAQIDDTNRRISLRKSESAPVVSVVVLAHDERDVTMRCIASIVGAESSSFVAEVIVVDGGSANGSRETAVRLTGAEYVHSDPKHGLARAFNQGAGIAHGTYLCFVHGADELLPGCLDRLVLTADEDDSVGIAGAKLIDLDGRLEAAGGVIWRDGTQMSYGEFGRPDDPQYNFLRDVDYVGSSALLVRADLFRRLGGFAERFDATDYESSDLCLGARSLGYRVVYQPFSEVVLGDDAISRMRKRTCAGESVEAARAAFCEKWATQLRGHLECVPDNVNAAARRINRQHTVLMLDSSAALPDGEAGSSRLTRVARILRQIGYSVVILPVGYVEPPYAHEMQQFGIEVLYRIGDESGRSWADAFDEVTLVSELAWIAGPLAFETYEPLMRHKTSTKVIYDAPGFHREAAWIDWQNAQLDCAARADATVVSNEDEKRAFELAGADEVYVVPNVRHDTSSGESDSTGQSPWTVELRLRELFGHVRRRTANARKA